MQSPNDYDFPDTHEGMTISHDYTVEPSLYKSFLEIFGDRSPIHVDDEYAQRCGFEKRVIHGAILSGFLSHFIGMRFPGRRALWLSSDLRYLKPSYVGDKLQLEATVAQKVESERVLVLHILFRNHTQGVVVAKGRVQVAVRDE